MNKFNLTKKQFTWYLSAIVALFIPFSIIADDGQYFPFTGVALLLLLLTSLTFYSTEKKTWFTNTLFGLSAVLSIYVMIFANPFLIFLNILSSIYLISILALDELTLINILLAPLMALSKAFTTSNKYKLNKIEFGQIKIPENTLTSLIITFIVLAIIIPLLSVSNPIFANLVQNIIDSLNIKAILEWIFNANFAVVISRFFFFAILIFLIPRFLTSINKKLKEKDVFASTPSKVLGLLVPKFAVIVVLATFFVTQVELYMASNVKLMALGYSRSEQINEVFAQLAVVAMIVFLLIFNDKLDKYKNKLTTYILIVQGFFLTAMALYSDYGYITSWGYTHKRLYGVAVVLWVTGLFALFTYKYLKQKSVDLFLKQTVILTGLIIVAINITNIDNLIVNGKQATTHKGVDYSYMIYSTYDAKNYEDILYKIDKEISANPDKYDESKNPDFYETYNIKYSSSSMIDRLESLQDKYFINDLYKDEKFDWRGFNLSEYKLAVRTKGDKLNELRKLQIKIAEMIKDNQFDYYPYQEIDPDFEVNLEPKTKSVPIKN